MDTNDKPEEQTAAQTWDAVLKEDSKLEVDPIQEAESAADAAVEEEDVVVEEKKPEEPKPDPLEALRVHLQRMEENNAKALRDLNGRFGGLSEQMKQVAKEATVAKAAAAPATQAAIKEAAKTPEKWEEFKKEWEGSSLVESIEEYVASQKSDPTQLVQESLAKARDEWNQQAMQREAKLQAQIVDLTMNQAHPGWKQTVKSTEFNTWRTAQPAAIQSLAASDNPEDAIAMLNLFKDTTASKAAEVKQDKAAANRERLQKAVNPVRSEVTPRKVLSVDEMTPEQLWAYEARIHAAKQKSAA